jgi:dihydrofolate synthase
MLNRRRSHSVTTIKRLSTTATETKTKLDILLNEFVNHEQRGVPKNAGTNTKQGFDLERMRLLLKEGFENPHEKNKYKIVHVGGTKGKGTVLTLIKSVLERSGYRVGTYKSPHVHSFAERIRVNGESNDEELCDLFNESVERVREVKKKNALTIMKTNEHSVAVKEEEEVSHFEVLTALALKYFEVKNVDIALVEVGLGGSRDATNVFDENSLECAVLTHIGEEHLDALGGSIETIVEAKTGICKKNKPVFIAPQRKKVENLLREAVASHGAYIIENNAEVTLMNLSSSILPSSPSSCSSSSLAPIVQTVNISVSPRNKIREGETLTVINEVNLPLLGPHQRENSALAVSVLSWMKSSGNWDKITSESIRDGLESCSSFTSPGNFEIIKSGSDGNTIIADGAHTQEAAACLRKTIGEVFPDFPVVFVIAMASDKNHAGITLELSQTPGMLEMVATKVDVAGKSLRSTEPEIIAKDQNFKGAVVRDFLSAIRYAENVLKKQGKRGIICVTGSLHSVTRAKREIYI